MNLKRMIMAAALAMAAACAGANSPIAPDAAVGGSTGDAPSSTPGAITVNGGGHYLLQGVFDTQFGLAAVKHANGEVSGNFHHKLADSSGTIDFTGTVTCLTFQTVNTATGIDRRVFVGGVITENRSTSPAFNGVVHQPGHDIWFRVTDRGEGPDAGDRTTFTGFEGAIPSSAAYCALADWRANDAGTHPVTEGNISISR